MVEAEDESVAGNILPKFTRVLRALCNLFLSRIGGRYLCFVLIRASETFD